MKELNRLLEDKSGDGEISFEASELHVNSDCDCCMEPTEKKMMVVYQGKWQWGFSINKTTQRFIPGELGESSRIEGKRKKSQEQRWLWKGVSVRN